MEIQTTLYSTRDTAIASGGDTMNNDSRIMEQIRELLLAGNSSRQVIKLGYRPGSVYGVLRQLRQKHTTTTENGTTNKNLTTHTHKSSQLTIHDVEFSIWHAEPPIRCPGCGKPVVHWWVCPLCSRLGPCDCDCLEDAHSPINGYSFSELVK
ncbi:hypothetical protein ACFLTV_00295 [Chloroflexota bacterium]